MTLTAIKTDAADRLHAVLSGDDFGTLYKKCIALAENCAAFLDGPGRQMMSSMPHDVRFSSMSAARNLTNDLVRIVSAALVLRSARDGIVPASKALEDIHLRNLLASTSVIKDGSGVPEEYQSIRFLAENLRGELAALIVKIEGNSFQGVNAVHMAINSINDAFSKPTEH